MKFDELTVEDILLLSSSVLRKPEIAKTLGVGEATVTRWRKKLGIKSKRGRPSVENGGNFNKSGEYRKCKMCSNLVYYKPSEIDVKTKCCSRECLHRDPEYRTKLLEIDRYWMDENWGAKPHPNTPEYRKYKGRVHRLTEKVYQDNIDIINPNRHPRTRCGVEGGWQLDHIKPVRTCFELGLSPEEASVVENLRMLPWKQNLMRQYDE